MKSKEEVEKTLFALYRDLRWARRAAGPLAMAEVALLEERIKKEEQRLYSGEER